MRESGRLLCSAGNCRCCCCCCCTAVVADAAPAVLLPPAVAGRRVGGSGWPAPLPSLLPARCCRAAATTAAAPAAAEAGTGRPPLARCFGTAGAVRTTLGIPAVAAAAGMGEEVRGRCQLCTPRALTARGCLSGASCGRRCCIAEAGRPIAPPVGPPLLWPELRPLAAMWFARAIRACKRAAVAARCCPRAALVWPLLAGEAASAPLAAALAPEEASLPSSASR